MLTGTPWALSRGFLTGPTALAITFLSRVWAARPHVLQRTQADGERRAGIEVLKLENSNVMCYRVSPIGL